MIDIKGIDKGMLFTVLYNNAKSNYSSNLFDKMLIRNKLDKIDYEAAKRVLEEVTSFTYFCGKPLFIDLSKDFLDEEMYDKLNGEGLAMESICNLKNERHLARIKRTKV